MGLIKKIYILPLVLIMITMVGCNNQVQDDIINYYEKELTEIIHLETEAIEAFNSVTGENYIDDNHFYNTLLETVIPKYSKFLERLKGIEPATKEVSKIHKLYIQTANTQYEAFLLMKKAVENQDKELVINANKELEKARELIKEWENQLEHLANQNKIVLE